MRFLFAFVLAIAAQSLLFSGNKNIPQDWRKNSVLDRLRETKFKLALKPKDPSRVEQALLSIATPGSQNFRKYLKRSEIASMTAADDSAIEYVSQWLTSNGAKVVSVPDFKDWIVASAPIHAIETMLKCKLASYSNQVLGVSNKVALEIGDDASYTIPDDIAKYVDFVAGMTSFVVGSRTSSATAVGASTVQDVIPQTIYDLYGTDSSGSHGSKVGSQAVVEFGNRADFSDEDTQQFFKAYQPALVGEVVGNAYGDNDGSSRHPSVEANLDVQYIMATGVFVNTTDYKITGNEDIEDLFLDYTLIVLDQTNPPLVHSISYGKYGGTYDNTTDQRFSYELQLMGLQGISVLLASGDNGVGCNTAGTEQEFDYPSSPFITMVGATYLDSKTKAEIGATLSSGGFSKDFMQASWQADAVNAYLNNPNVKMPKESFYAPGRAYPDIAAFGQNLQIISGGKEKAVSGTSASAPIFAGVIALLNHELMSKGKAPLGFLNPWLYAYPNMYTDVTTGSNPYQKCEGFEAAAGWDPVTGMGTPLYPQMKINAFLGV